MNFLKRLSYRTEVSKLAQALHLLPLLRRSYYRWARPAGGVVEVKVGGKSGRYRVRTYRELRIMDAVEIGERVMLDELMRFVEPGDMVYDVGANIGLYTILLAQAVGPQGGVAAFEPEAESYEHLRDNLELNGLTQVRCIPKALGEASGEGRLYVLDGVTCPTLLAPPAGLRGAQITSQTVPLETGDRLVAEEKLPPPRAVKIDVEGYEQSVIAGLSGTLAGPRCELVCCEVHPHLLPRSGHSESIVDQLRALGFEHIERRRRKRDDNFFLVARKRAPGTCP
jgi:FkbM family methyltransferase